MTFSSSNSEIASRALIGARLLVHLHEAYLGATRHSRVMDVLRLVLVDDYRMVTEALASRLSAAPDLWVAGCCQTDDPRLPEVVRWLRPDMVLIDVEPLGIAIAEVLGRIRTAWPDAKIIVVSADEEVAHAVEAARAGADAWVSKSQGADQLETVLRGVARGQSWFPPEMLGPVIRGLRDDVETARESSNLLETLSPRELDVLTSMATGKRARQIAAELMISADTVRTHTRSIFGKLEVHSRIEAVSVAWAAGLRPEEATSPGEESDKKGPSGSGEGRPATGRPRRPALPGQSSGGSDQPGRAGFATRRSRPGRRGEAERSGGEAGPGGKPAPGGKLGEGGESGRSDESGRGGRPGRRGPGPGMQRHNPGPAASGGRPAVGERAAAGERVTGGGPLAGGGRVTSSERVTGGERVSGGGRPAGAARPAGGGRAAGAVGGGPATSPVADRSVGGLVNRDGSSARPGRA